MSVTLPRECDVLPFAQGIQQGKYHRMRKLTHVPFAHSFEDTDDPVLSQHTLGLVQRTFQDKYDAWAQDAPWKDEDPFFLRSDPCVVVYQYGQNQRIFTVLEEDDYDEQLEVAAFEKEFNWPSVGLYTYAIATTIRYVFCVL